MYLDHQACCNYCCYLSDDVNIELNGTHVCIYYKGILLKCVKRKYNLQL